MKIALLIILIVSVLLLVTAGLATFFALRRKAIVISLSPRARRVTLENVSTASPLQDARAVAAYKRVLTAHLHPSRVLQETITDEEYSAIAALHTSLPIVLAFATHPHRRNDILNLIAASDDVFLVIVGEYVQGLEPKVGCVCASFNAERFASFIYDGMLYCNSRFLRLAEDKEGLTVAGHFCTLPESPLEPLDTPEFSYILDTDSYALILDTHARTKWVYRPDAQIVNVKNIRGHIVVETSEGQLSLTATGCKVRLVWDSGLALRISSKYPATIQLGHVNKTMTQLREAHKMYLTHNLLVDFSADQAVETLKAAYAPVMAQVLSFRRSGRIHNALQAAAVCAATLEPIPLSALKSSGDEYDLSALILLCVKSYRGSVLTVAERDCVAHAATTARRLGGLYRAFTFKLMGLMGEEDRNALRAPFLSLAVDTLTVAKWASALAEPEKTLVVTLFCGSKVADIAELTKNFGQRSLFAQVATYVLLRTRLLGVKLKDGRLYCAPAVPTLKSLEILNNKIDVESGGEVCIVAHGVKYYTNVLPKKSGLHLITTA